MIGDGIHQVVENKFHYTNPVKKGGGPVPARPRPEQIRFRLNYIESAVVYFARSDAALRVGFAGCRVRGDLRSAHVLCVGDQVAIAGDDDKLSRLGSADPYGLDQTRLDPLVYGRAASSRCTTKLWYRHSYGVSVHIGPVMSNLVKYLAGLPPADRI